MDMKDYVFEEYKMLRGEVLQSMRNRNAILTFGLAVLGIIFHAGMSSFSAGTKESYWLSFLIFYLAIPSISLLILTLWFWESVRINRVGRYLMEREDLMYSLSGSILKSLKGEQTSGKIKKYPNHYDKVLFWEHYIREGTEKYGKTKKLISSYNAVIGLFLSISVACVIVGILFPLRMLHLSTYTYMSVILIVMALLVIFRIGYLYLKRIESETSSVNHENY